MPKVHAACGKANRAFKKYVRKPFMTYVWRIVLMGLWTKVVKPSWEKGIVPAWQHVPPEAVVTLDDLRDTTMGILPVAVLCSHSRRSRCHLCLHASVDIMIYEQYLSC